MAKRKVVVYIATSVDGFIAQEGDKLDFLSLVEKEGEDYGYNQFIDTVSTVIVGRRTYNWVIQHVPVFPHSSKETFVITSEKRESEGNIQFYNQSPVILVKQLLQNNGGTIFVDGGANVIHQLLDENLIDELILSVIPILVGKGTRLFQDRQQLNVLQLKSEKHFDKGLVQLHYVVKK